MTITTFGKFTPDAFVTVWAKDMTQAKAHIRSKGWSIKSAYAEGQQGGWKKSAIYPNKSYRIQLGRKK
jgi:hypothetical protein